MKLLIATVSILILNSLTSYAQATKKQKIDPCGYDYIREHAVNEKPQEFKILAKQFQDFQKSSKGLSAKNNNSIVTIPVVFHIVHNGEALGTGPNYSIDHLQKLIDYLNYHYQQLAPNKITDGYPSSTPDTRFRFCMAQTTPSGLQDNAVTRTLGRDYYIFNTREPLDTDFIVKQWKWDPNVYLNIYITDLRDSRDVQSIYGLGGYASLPEAGTLDQGVTPDANDNNSRLFDGIVMNHHFLDFDEDYVGFRLEDAFVHEVGHWLGLWHTFNPLECQGYESGREDCEKAGDLICDTPIVAVATRSNDYFNLEGPDYVKSCKGPVISGQNHMDYCEKSTFFTPGQIARMHQITQFYRPDIYSEKFRNADCTIKTDILNGPRGGGNTLGDNELGSFFESSFSNKGPNSQPIFEKTNFGTAVAIDENWMVSTDMENNMLEIFQKVYCNFISYQYFSSSYSGFGKEVIFNENEIIVTSDSRVFVYNFDGEFWFKKQEINMGTFNSIFQSNGDIFILGKNPIRIYSKTRGGSYSFKQNLSHNNLPKLANEITTLNKDILMLSSANQKILTISKNTSGTWYVRKETTHSGLYNKSSVKSIAANDKNLVILYEKTNGGKPPFTLTSYSTSITSSFELTSNTYFRGTDLRTISDRTAVRSMKPGKIRFVNDDIFVADLSSNNGGSYYLSTFKKQSNGSWSYYTMKEDSKRLPNANRVFAPRTIGNSKFDFSANTLIIGGGDGKVYAYKTTDFLNSSDSPKFKRICHVPNQSDTYSDRIYIGGSCDVTFDGANKSFVAKSGVKLEKGVRIKSGSIVHIADIDETESYCSSYTKNEIVKTNKSPRFKVSTLADLSKGYKEVEDEVTKNQTEIFQKVKIMPNPTSGVFSVIGVANYRIAKVILSNPSGARIKEIEANDNKNIEVDILGQPAGMYLLRIEFKNVKDIALKKVIKY